jgi:hypothetical protein
VDHPAVDDARKFLSLWFGEKPKGYILIWTNPGKRSEWFNEIDSASRYAIGETTRNVYFGTSLGDKDYGARYRLHSTKRPAKGLSGLYSDIDIAGSDHKKKNYPPDLESARKLVEDIPVKPSCIVGTGGGIHCYWIFHEPWIFENDEQRQLAQALSRRWHRLILTAADAHGWTMDNVSDLERVMRVPGTFNNKDPRNPKPVTILEQSTWRYSPDDFDMFLQDVRAQESVVVPITIGKHKSTPAPEQSSLVLSIDAQPPIEKFQALLSNIRKARETWEHKRKDLKDQSGSSYDMALANFCVASGFTQQEVVNSLIAMRRKHNDPNLPNKMREGYFKGTYEKAYKTFSEEAETNRKRDRAHQKFISSDEEEQREGALELFNEIAGTDIIEVVAFITGEGAEYHIKTNKGSVVMPSDDVWSFTRFSRVYFNAFQEILKDMRPKDWKTKALPMLVNRATKEGVREDLRDEGSDRMAMRGWIEDYLMAHHVSSDLTLDVYKEERPVKDEEGNHYVRNDHLRRYIGRRKDSKIRTGQMPSLLKSAGLEPTKRKIIGTNRQVRFWKLPAEKVIPFPKAKSKHDVH